MASSERPGPMHAGPPFPEGEIPMTKRSALAPLALLLLASARLHAAECTGASFPDTVDVAGTPLKLNGLGLREATMLSVDVYVAGLYVEKSGNDGAKLAAADEKKKLHLKFVRNVGKADIAKAWSEGFEKNVKDLAPLQKRIDELNGWMADVGKGDEIAFTYVPGTGLDVEVKGASKGTIPGADFAAPFFAIWLGDSPPNPGLKKGLLGGGCP